MDNIRQLKDHEVIENEAAQWVWRLDDDQVSEETQAAFEAWLKEDPRHQRVMDDYSSLWGQLDLLQASRREERIRTVSRGIDAQEGGRVTPSAWRYGAIAACLAMLVVALVFTGGPDQATGTGPQMIAERGNNYTTAVGEFRTVTLEDGSVIEMNTDTELTVRFDRAARHVELARGEAHFNVAKNPRRPFVVTANGASVRAVGTAFNVRSVRQAPIEVMVTEGTVEVTEYALGTESPQAPTGGEQLFLTAGQSIRVDQVRPTQIAAVSPADLDRELAWRKGMLVFEGEPLESVVEELSRYTDVRFVIVDDAIRQKQVGGYFRTGDLDALLSVLEEGLSIKIERRDDDIILMSDQSAG